MSSELVFYGRLGRIAAEQDYEPNRLCVRLYAVDTKAFEESLFNREDGCTVYNFDIGIGDAAAINRRQMRNKTLPFHYFRNPLKFFRKIMAPDCWVKISFNTASYQTNSYYYRLFDNIDPKYIEVKSFEIVHGSELLPFARVNFQPRSPSPTAQRAAPQSSAASSTPPSGTATLMAYHVGQGMCALLREGSRGCLFDAGAGKPILRPDYMKGHLSNDLLTDVGGLTDLEAVISHSDEDHWRLLEWDASLASKVSAIYVPSGTRSLALSSSAVKPKIRAVSSYTWHGGSSAQADALRSSPYRTSNNSQCLVTEVIIGTTRALLSGDYVYREIARDAVPAVRALVSQPYDAVMVPHHGDRASSQQVVSPATPGVSVAFFSAGTHRKYRHPSTESLQAHADMDFVVISDRKQTNIVRQILL